MNAEFMKVRDEVAVAPHVRNHKCPAGREDNKTAKILRFYEGDSGRVILDRDLQGCRYWNVSDLTIARFSF